MTTQLNEKFTVFYGGVFSQWTRATFVVDGVTFNCTEQYMMYKKALMFGDYNIAEEIMHTEHPRDQKALGREVSGFENELWEAHCIKIVRDGNYAKFTQNKDLLAEMAATVGTELVEASPVDKIWGIGLAPDDPKAHNRGHWKGKNWLGIALTQVREQLIDEGVIK